MLLNSGVGENSGEHDGQPTNQSRVVTEGARLKLLHFGHIMSRSNSYVKPVNIGKGVRKKGEEPAAKGMDSMIVAPLEHLKDQVSGTWCVRVCMCAYACGYHSGEGLSVNR